jgi:hypothetical protein
MAVISAGEYQEAHLSNRIRFTDDEILRIRERCINGFYFSNNLNIELSNCARHDTGFIITEIIKLGDEWYYIKLNSIKFFKCDQFDELLNKLEDIRDNPNKFMH